MKKSFLSRTWISPLVAVAFGVIGVTGLLLFFHVKNGSIVTLHEWFGWAFVLTGAVHLLLNWRPLASYFCCRSAFIALTLSALLVVAFTAGGSSGHESDRGKSLAPVVAALDLDGNGVVEGPEIASANVTLLKVDTNGDGKLSADELAPQRAGGHGEPH
jgi:hypothetical protein